MKCNRIVYAQRIATAPQIADFWFDSLPLKRDSYIYGTVYTRMGARILVLLSNYLPRSMAKGRNETIHGIKRGIPFEDDFISFYTIDSYARPYYTVSIRNRWFRKLYDRIIYESTYYPLTTYIQSTHLSNVTYCTYRCLRNKENKSITFLKS